MLPDAIDVLMRPAGRILLLFLFAAFMFSACGSEEDNCPKACVELLECIESDIPVYCHCPGKETPECVMTSYLSPEDVDCILSSSDCNTILECSPPGIFSPPCR